MKRTPLLIALFVLAGCSSVLPKGEPAPTFYTLNASTTSQVAEGTHISSSLRILMPQAVPGLATDKVALRKTDNQIDYYTGVRWSSSLEELVQSQLVQQFDNARQLQSVSNDLVAVNQDYSLLVEIQDFQIEYRNGKQVARVKLTAKLIKTVQNKIVTTSVYHETETSQGNTIQQVVKAVDLAYQRASTKLVEDILQTLRQKASPKSPKP